MKTRIVNVVSTADLGQKIDLYKLRQFKEIAYDPKKYQGRVAYFKSREMKGKVSIFSSGKLISVGTKSESAAARELRKVNRFLASEGIVHPVVIESKCHNVVALIELEDRINLEELAEKSRVIYEPDQFPGGILKIEKTQNTTLLLFASGKVIAAGLTSSRQVKPVTQELLSILAIKSSMPD
jgi:transcription initiation factor TFIID TATA-box-binding protein